MQRKFKALPSLFLASITPTSTDREKEFYLLFADRILLGTVQVRSVAWEQPSP